MLTLCSLQGKKKKSLLVVTGLSSTQGSWKHAKTLVGSNLMAEKCKYIQGGSVRMQFSKFLNLKDYYVST